MVRPRRDTPVDLSKNITAVAQRRLAQHGAAGLSLRAIARELGITAPAIYNYFPRREDLITAIILEAYTSLTEAVAAARDLLPSGDHTGRLLATGRAYREWALANPESYNLIFGTPIPGYHAPVEVTQPVAARSLAVLIGVLDAAWQAGELAVDQALFATHPALLPQIEVWRQSVGSTAHPYAHYLGLIIWTRVHGLVSIELYHQIPPPIDDNAEIYEVELESICRQLGLGENDKQDIEPTS